MRLKNDTNNFAASFNITPPYQMMVIHSSKLIYPREVYQRRVHRSQVELIAADFNEYIANEQSMNHDQPFFDNRISFILAFIAKVRNPL